MERHREFGGDTETNMDLKYGHVSGYVYIIFQHVYMLCDNKLSMLF